MKLLVAATGGVAALKTPLVVRRLLDGGHDVRVVATDDAYRFVTPLALAIASGSAPFDRDAWFEPTGRALHLELAAWADALLVAPASADALASAAHGRADDVVSALVIAGVPRVAWVPAMNTRMWEHPAVRANVRTLASYGHRFLGPASGPLAARGEGSGAGRMLEPEEIAAALEGTFRTPDLQGRRLLVSAGPTREPLDPVRFLSNPSSGKMGYAVAEAARDRGADVTLVSGPTSLPDPHGVRVTRIETALELLAALEERVDDCEALVMSAAVADWRAREVLREKEAKAGETKTIEFVRTPDILEALARRKGSRVFVGFAMETHEGIERAADKARRKDLDFICLNYPARTGTAFGGDHNQITIVRPDGSSTELPRLTKRAAADAILDRLVALLP